MRGSGWYMARTRSQSIAWHPHDAHVCCRPTNAELLTWPPCSGVLRRRRLRGGDAEFIRGFAAVADVNVDDHAEGCHPPPHTPSIHHASLPAPGPTPSTDADERGAYRRRPASAASTCEGGREWLVA